MSRQETKDLLKEWRVFLKEAPAKPSYVAEAVQQQKPAREVHLFSVLEVILDLRMPIIGNNSFYLSFLNDAGIKQAYSRKLIRTATKELTGYTIKQQNEILSGAKKDTAAYVVGTLNVANPTSENEEGEEEIKAYLENGYMENLILKGDQKALIFFTALTGLDRTKFQSQKKGKLKEATETGRQRAMRARSELKTILLPIPAKPFDAKLGMLSLKDTSTAEEVEMVLQDARKLASDKPELAAKTIKTAAQPTVSASSTGGVKKPEKTEEPQQNAPQSFKEALLEASKPFIRVIKAKDPEIAAEEMLESYKHVVIEATKLARGGLDLTGKITVINTKDPKQLPEISNFISGVALKPSSEKKESRVIVHSRDNMVDDYIQALEKDVATVIDSFEYLADTKNVQQEARIKKTLRKYTKKEMEERVFMEVKNLLGKIIKT